MSALVTSSSPSSEPSIQFSKILMWDIFGIISQNLSNTFRDHEPINNGPGAKSNLAYVFVREVLLKHSHTHLPAYCPRLLLKLQQS
jgi:hypothetical protein